MCCSPLGHKNVGHNRATELNRDADIENGCVNVGGKMKWETGIEVRIDS